jgi:hypothetical protein
MKVWFIKTVKYMDTVILQPDNNNSNSSGVGIATGYGLDGQEVGVRVPIRARFSSLHPASYPMGKKGKAIPVTGHGGS